MLSLLGFSACIETNGTPLPEYLVSVDDKSSKVSCWIPGIEGQVGGMLPQTCSCAHLWTRFRLLKYIGVTRAPKSLLVHSLFWMVPSSLADFSTVKVPPLEKVSGCPRPLNDLSFSRRLELQVSLFFNMFLCMNFF